MMADPEAPVGGQNPAVNAGALNDFYKGYWADRQKVDPPAATHTPDPRWDTARKHMDILQEAAMFYPNLIAQGVKAGVTAPGEGFRRAYEGNPPGPEETFQMAQNVAGLVAGGGVGRAATGAGVGELGTFMGRGSKTWNTGAQLRAEFLENQGLSKDTIWKHTGLERGTDGQWRAEIPDVTAKAMAGEPPTVGLLIRDTHPELLKAYPELKDLPLKWDSAPGNAVYIPPSIGKEHISLPPYGGDRLSLLLHEIQHWIQEKEGFAKGTGPNATIPIVRNVYGSTVDNEKIVAAGREAYLRSAGETESRNVPYRLEAEKQFPGYSKGRRPELSEDTPRDKQSVHHGYLSPDLGKSLANTEQNKQLLTKLRQYLAEKAAQ